VAIYTGAKALSRWPINDESTLTPDILRTSTPIMRVGTYGVSFSRKDFIIPFMRSVCFPRGCVGLRLIIVPLKMSAFELLWAHLPRDRATLSFVFLLYVRS
jgi:hypothetical protein